MIAPPRSILAFLRLTLALALAGIFEVLYGPQCPKCGRRWDPHLMRDDGRCAFCHRAGKDGAT